MHNFNLYLDLHVTACGTARVTKSTTAVNAHKRKSLTICILRTSTTGVFAVFGARTIRLPKGF